MCIGMILSFFQVYAAATSDQYLAAGNTLYQQKNYDRAVLYYKAAIQMDPNNAAAHTRLANTYYLLGQKPQALVEYKAALALNPNNAQLANFVQRLDAQLNSAPAQPSYTAPQPSYSPVKSFDLNAGLGIASGGEGWGLGIGGTVSGYVPLEKGFELGGSIGVYDFSYSSATTVVDDEYGFDIGSQTTTDNESLLAIEVLASGKYVFDGNGIKPYLVGGAGLALLSESTSETVVTTVNPPYNSYYAGGTTNTSSSSSSTNPMLQVGAGLSLSLGTSLSGFAEVKYSMVIGSGGTWSYIPFNVGLGF